MGRSLNRLGKKPVPKERSQPEWGKKLGFLQKHKDYVVRSTAFKRRKSQLDNLRKKAAFRNPDEFYFQMINTKTLKNGKHDMTEQKQTKQALKKLTKDDIRYFSMKCTVEKNKLQRIIESHNKIIINNETDSNITDSGDEPDKETAEFQNKIQNMSEEDKIK
eukprot:UN11691